MISFYQWAINFREEEGNLGAVGFSIYDDPNFPKKTTSFETIKEYLVSSCEILPYTIRYFEKAFEQYEKEIKQK